MENRFFVVVPRTVMVIAMLLSCLSGVSLARHSTHLSTPNPVAFSDCALLEPLLVGAWSSLHPTQSAEQKHQVGLVAMVPVDSSQAHEPSFTPQSLLQHIDKRYSAAPIAITAKLERRDGHTRIRLAGVELAGLATTAEAGNLAAWFQSLHAEDGPFNAVYDSLRYQLRGHVWDRGVPLRVFVSNDPDLEAGKFPMVEFFSPEEGAQNIVISAAYLERMAPYAGDRLAQRWFAVHFHHAALHQFYPLFTPQDRGEDEVQTLGAQFHVLRKAWLQDTSNDLWETMLGYLSERGLEDINAPTIYGRDGLHRRLFDAHPSSEEDTRARTKEVIRTFVGGLAGHALSELSGFRDVSEYRPDSYLRVTTFQDLERMVHDRSRAIGKKILLLHLSSFPQRKKLESILRYDGGVGVSLPSFFDPAVRRIRWATGGSAYARTTNWRDQRIDVVETFQTLAHVYDGSLGSTDGSKNEIGEVWTVVEANAYSLRAEVFANNDAEALYGATDFHTIFKKSDAAITEDLHALQTFIDAIGLPVAHVFFVESPDSLGHYREDHRGFLNLLAGMMERSLKVRPGLFDWGHLALTKVLALLQSEQDQKEREQAPVTDRSDAIQKRKRGTTASIPDAAALLAVLSARTAEGKENYASVLAREASNVYSAALKFRREVTLPRKPSSWVASFKKPGALGPSNQSVWTSLLGVVPLSMVSPMVGLLGGLAILVFTAYGISKDPAFFGAENGAPEARLRTAG